METPSENVKLDILIKFTGVVEVEVPATLKPEHQKILGQKLALSRIVASFDNPDAPDEEACEDYASETGKDEDEAGQDWDASRVTDLNGTWKTEAQADAFLAGLNPSDDQLYVIMEHEPTGIRSYTLILGQWLFETPLRMAIAGNNEALESEVARAIRHMKHGDVKHLNNDRLVVARMR